MIPLIKNITRMLIPEMVRIPYIIHLILLDAPCLLHCGMAGITPGLKLYWHEVCEQAFAAIFFNVEDTLPPSFVEKPQRLLESRIVNALGNIFLLVGMVFCPLRFQFPVFLLNRLECLEVLKRLLYAAVSYNLHPFRAFYILHAFYEVAGHVSPFIQHILVYCMKEGLGHKLAGLSPFSHKVFPFLVYNFINDYAKTDNCNEQDCTKYLEQQALFKHG